MRCGWSGACSFSLHRQEEPIAMRLALLVIATLLVPTVAAAQPGLAAPYTVVERHGIFAGGGLWGGNISCDGPDCGDFREAGGANGHIGYLFGPRLGLILDIWAMTSEQNDVAITYVAATVGARLWLLPRLWVQGGIGSGHAEVRVGPFGARGDDVPAGELAAGIELVRGPSFSLDLSIKGAAGSKTDDNGDITTGKMGGIGISMTWFAHRHYAPMLAAYR
jgi:hypothetical protein